MIQTIRQTDAKTVAFNMREGNSFKMLAMLTEADLKGVKKHDKFYLKHAQKLERAKKRSNLIYMN